MKTLRKVVFTPEFVEYVPTKLEENIVYISLTYKVAVFNCLCGCGERTALPLNKDHWSLIQDNDKVSFEPSISNHQYPCKSHYVITNNVANFI